MAKSYSRKPGSVNVNVTNPNTTELPLDVLNRSIVRMERDRDNASGSLLSSQHQFKKVQTNGTNWFIIGTS